MARKNKKILKENLENLILKKYHDPKFPGSFSGIRKFYLGLKQNKIKVKLKDLKDILLKDYTYTRHRPVKHNFQTSKVFVNGIDHTWQMDLVDVQKLSKQNDSFKYILTVIDVFSKYAWAIPLRSKKSDDVLQAIIKILEDSRKPKKIQVDQGTEFLNKKMQGYLEKNNIKTYYTNSEKKASVVERFNRTLKEKMWRYFSLKDTMKYIDIINDLVKSYNHSYHRSIKMKPIDVNGINENQVYKNLYGYYKDEIDNTVINPKFKVDDLVRLSKWKGTFEKGYTPNWSSEIYKITDVIANDPPVYKIKDFDNKPIKGLFYEQELLKILTVDYDEGEYPIEILEERKDKKGNVIKIKVHWIGYSKKYDQWIDPV